ncbi:hypothetical protein SDJN03_21728, partial [Cucurbita argyrosperma subsp. sororia]
MAGKSLNASIVKLALLSIVCIVILAPSIMAVAPDPYDPSNISISGCESFIKDSAVCIVSVIKARTGDHPSCCKAISDLDTCSHFLYKHIPDADMDAAKKLCGM